MDKMCLEAVGGEIAACSAGLLKSLGLIHTATQGERQTKVLLTFPQPEEHQTQGVSWE